MKNLPSEILNLQSPQQGSLRDLIVDRCQNGADIIQFTREFYHAALQIVQDNDIFDLASRGFFPELKGDTVVAVQMWWELMLIWYSALLSPAEKKAFVAAKVIWA